MKQKSILRSGEKEVIIPLILFLKKKKTTKATEGPVNMQMAGYQL